MAGTTEIRHYLVEGHVQGVGYRRFVQRTGEGSELSGVVRNLRDGRVEVLVSGPGDVLEAFATELRRGPLHSKVTNLKMKKPRPDELPVEAAKPFAVLTDGERPWFQ